MSRFFAGGASSDSESESSSDEEILNSSSGSESESESGSDKSGSDEESDDSMFNNESESESESDEEGGAAKGPAYFLKNQFLRGGADSDEESDDEGKRVVKSAKDKLIDDIDASIKIIDNAKRINDWISISSEFDKMNKLVEKANKQYSEIPSQYIKTLAGLEDFLEEAVKAEKSAKKMNASNARALNTIKQRLKKNNRDYESKITAYRADPEAYEKAALANAPISAIPTAKRGASVETNDDLVDDQGFAVVGKAGKAVEEVDVFKTLATIIESRGKKNVDRYDQIKTLEGLITTTTSAYEIISILLALIPLRFDSISSSQFLSVESWRATSQDVTTLLATLEKNSAYSVIESAEEIDDLYLGPKSNAQGVKEIRGSIASLVERLDDELNRSLQNIDPHTTEYADRLRDQVDLYAILIRTQVYVEKYIKGNLYESEALSRLLSRRVDHIYYKSAKLIGLTEVKVWESIPAELDSKLTPRVTGTIVEGYSVSLLNSICSVLYKQTNTIYRTKAMLSHIYQYALNDQYFKARDMFLMSHLQSSIHSAESTIQVLYNRALAQVGLCAFRVGLIPETQTILQDLCSSSKQRELLGQGTGKFQQQSNIVEKQRLLPFHTHINSELLECVYLTASLLLEVPCIATAGSSSTDSKKKVISKSFRRLLENVERNVFNGPPENTRDHIMQAAMALLEGDWKAARELLTSIKIWKFINNPETIKAMLGEKVQEVALIAFFNSDVKYYSTISIATLASTFELTERRVKAIVSKVIANEDISAAIDEKTQSVVVRQGVELTKLQELALALSDKAFQLTERNERLMSGGYQLSDKPTGSSNPNNTNSGNNNANNANSNNSGNNAGNKQNQNRKPHQGRSNNHTHNNNHNNNRA
ncbi:hypothetical protein NADFUDRAFT_81217 [Nadsonia fulvescens var. elongata DSM 6958]|uniref:Eukaryotic translation initiation factor 3 subunit C n=1 Tax=Nadsonia fulvescens var. elongata DSM 6958 TaxID=857566 RepID=A0A1E3PS68_9ASCO|nr:hypothetical protein NADFUDRAFT_81217 [Nadsonia fulvescens var. elongata DSM 6958]